MSHRSVALLDPVGPRPGRGRAVAARGAGSRFRGCVQLRRAAWYERGGGERGGQRPGAVIDLCHCLLNRYGAVHLRDDLDEALERLSSLTAEGIGGELAVDAARAFGLGMVYRGDLDESVTDLAQGVEVLMDAWLKAGHGHPDAGEILSLLMMAAGTHARHTQAPSAIDRGPGGHRSAGPRRARPAWRGRRDQEAAPDRAVQGHWPDL